MTIVNELPHAQSSTTARAPAASLDLAGIVVQLRSARERWREQQARPREVSGRELPSREALAAIVDDLRGALFPMRDRKSVV